MIPNRAAANAAMYALVGARSRIKAAEAEAELKIEALSAKIAALRAELTAKTAADAALEAACLADLEEYARANIPAPGAGPRHLDLDVGRLCLVRNSHTEIGLDTEQAIAYLEEHGLFELVKVVKSLRVREVAKLAAVNAEVAENLQVRKVEVDTFSVLVTPVRAERVHA